MPVDNVREIALDLSRLYPRSPRATLGGYVIAARTLDKCRAAIAETLGAYHFDCPLDNEFFGFTEMAADAFREDVGTGAEDAEVAKWIVGQAKSRPRIEVIRWNNRMRELRIGELDDARQEFLEEYIPQNLPAGRAVHVWFDVYDIEEGRL